MFCSRISTFVLFQVRGLPEATGCHPPHQIEPGSQMQGSNHGPNRGPHHEHRNLRCAMLCALHHWTTKAKAERHERQRQMATTKRNADGDGRHSNEKRKYGLRQFRHSWVLFALRPCRRCGGLDLSPEPQGRTRSDLASSSDNRQKMWQNYRQKHW